MQYIVGSFEIVRGLKPPRLTKNMEIFSDFDQTTHILLYFTANTWYNSANTYLIDPGGCIVDEKLSLSRIKIVQHGPLTLCFRQHINIFLIIICYIAITYNEMFYNIWLYQCISIV